MKRKTDTNRIWWVKINNKLFRDIKLNSMLVKENAKNEREDAKGSLCLYWSVVYKL